MNSSERDMRISDLLDEYFPFGSAPFGLHSAIENLMEDVRDEAFRDGQLSMLPD